MFFVDVLGELLNDDLGKLAEPGHKNVELTLVLLIGLGLLPRLALRLSLLYLPFLRGLRLTERGEIERRGLEGDLESGLPFETSEYGDRVRGRPRGGEGDLEGIFAMKLEELEECEVARVERKPKAVNFLVFVT
jgi:hypothetical protein